MKLIRNVILAGLPFNLTLGLAAVSLLGALTPAAGHSPVPDASVPGALVDVEVKVGNRTTPLFFAPGHPDRRYFEASRGRSYSLVVTNQTGRRVGVLIAVDGLNVVNGERSTLSNQEAMYVLDPWERAEIRGWRTSLREVRKFVFVDEERSYAERSGKANADMGWIRVLAFQEAGTPWLSDRGDDRGRRVPMEPYAAERDGAASPADEGAPSPQGSESQLKTERRNSDRRESRDSNPGTGWGDRSRDPVNRTWFTAEYQPADHIVLRYEYASGLRALGIDIRRHRDRLWEREQGDFGFAQPPRW